MGKLFRYIVNYKYYLGISACCHLLTAIFTVISIPLIIPFFQILFEREVPSIIKPSSVLDLANWIKYFGAQLLNNYSKTDALLIVCVSIVIVFFFKNLFRYLSSYFLIPLRNGVVRDIRQDLYKSILSLPIPYFDRHSRGDLISRINSDSVEIEWSILSFLEVLFKSPLIIIGALAFMIYVSVQLSLFVLVLIIFTIGIIGFVSRRLKQDSSEVQKGLGRLSAITEQSLIGVDIIKAYKASEFMQNSFNRENNRILRIINRLLRKKELSSPLSEFLGVSIVAVLLAYGSSLVFSGELLPETFFAFIFAFYQVIEPSKSFSTAYYNMRKGLAAVDRVEEINNLASLNNKKNRASKFPDDWKALVFKELSFSYDKDLDNRLNGINFKLPKGGKLAIIGSSGSGKSTILKLILQQYEAQEGKILIDETELSKIDLNELHDKIAVVSQQAVLFNDSIKANILLGRAYDEEKLQFVIEVAHLTSLISNLELGIEHNVGDSGGLLSGGEKQRITIARALYGNPEIILFDEATSALDAHSERLVTAAIKDAIKNRTAIIIAHRQSTMKLATDLIVLEDGKIVQQGLIKELSKQKAKFKSYLDS